MDKSSIKEIIIETLPAKDRTAALEFIYFLHENKLELIRDNGYLDLPLKKWLR